MNFLDKVRKVLGTYDDPTNPVKTIKSIYFKTWLFSYFPNIANSGGSLRHIKSRISAWAEYNTETRQIFLKTLVPKSLTPSKKEETTLHQTVDFPWRSEFAYPLAIKLATIDEKTISITYAAYPGLSPVMNEVLKHDMKAIGIHARIEYNSKSKKGLIKPDTIDDNAMIKFYYSELFKEIPPEVSSGIMAASNTLTFPSFAMPKWTQMNYTINVPAGITITLPPGAGNVLTTQNGGTGYTVVTTTITTGVNNTTVGYQAMNQADIDALQADIDTLSQDMTNMFKDWDV